MSQVPGEVKLQNKVRIIGGGLAGSEAAWQCARRGVAVELFEMRPARSTYRSNNMVLIRSRNGGASVQLVRPHGLELAR